MNLRKALLLILIVLQQQMQAQSLDTNVKRIVFIGNSITWAGMYVNDVEAYLRVQYPGRQWEFINLGVPSETVSGLSEPAHANGDFPRPDLHERLGRVLEQTKPDLVFACYGMNDGIYMPLDEERFQKFRDGITWLHDTIIKSGAKIIHLTPPVYDEKIGKVIGYAAVLDRYTDWLLSMRRSSKWEVVDVHYPMKKFLEAHRKTDSKFNLNGFALAPDGIHPGETGHWIMARQILVYLGFKNVGRSPGIIESLPGLNEPGKYVEMITKRQTLLRDAWLTATKHKRPGLPAGLPLNEAEVKASDLMKEIERMLSKKN
jgi:lysophospholipase L1-like esterase